MIRPPVNSQLSEEMICEKMLSVLLSYSDIVKQTGISLEMEEYLLLREHTINELNRNASTSFVQKSRPTPANAYTSAVQIEPQKEHTNVDQHSRQNNQNNIHSFPQLEQDDEELSELDILNSIKDS